ncbi:hypothetical protein [Spiroplasma endosymbiont of Danaus chrysippus]|uniref:hypothetical protein n=1 Tax=Spiroplasma endosymbiont of Danaus chrysippus TaxID=2691041 RepID=UPI00157B2ADA|nr:hypothetical protein [Spiroplasma endosymbiont of Danaus chrysippus]
MEFIYKYFNEKSHIIIYSAKPQDLTSSNDIRAILLDEYPKLRNDYFIVSDVHDSYAICVGDNINCEGKVIIKIEKQTNLLKGVNENAKWHQCTIK